VLIHHPDKKGDAGAGSAGDGGGGGGDVDIRLVNEARWVLGDPERRREWEAASYGESQPKL